MTYIGIGVTTVASSFLLFYFVDFALSATTSGQYTRLLETIVFGIVIAFFVYGSLVYLFARVGHLSRLSVHRPAREDELVPSHPDLAPRLTILVPSYREEIRTIRHTLLSAALLRYPNRRIALLIDDPPHPTDAAAIAQLKAARALPAELQRRFDAIATKLQATLAPLAGDVGTAALDAANGSALFARAYLLAAEWLEEQAADHRDSVERGAIDHTDRFFIDNILLAPATAYRERAEEFAARASGALPVPSDADLRREHCWLGALFRAELTSFERKRYANLSHAPNKAMNLNAYLSLVGGSFRETVGRDGLHLVPCGLAEASVIVPAADYVITLDADSMLLGDYALRLAAVMEAPGNERMAVAQTPYSSFPGATSMVERIAGATTDIQHIIHQGFTSADATYWVGANAMIRFAALADICTTRDERGHHIKVFIQDRTVIEDTESSIDLVARGWSLYNYPDRLAFSATPPDFGSLLIQRRRWANGGLIILPKLLRFLLSCRDRRLALRQAPMRIHYLTSLAGVSVGLVLLLAYPFDQALTTIWLPLTALPYYVIYCRDLVSIGYRWRDLFSVYALNLVLVPVHLAGVGRSIQQMLSGRPTPFGRTPKILGRTAAPSGHVIVLFLILFGFANAVLWDLVGHRWLHALFAAVNGGFFLFGIHRFVGWKNGLEDIRIGLRSHRLAAALRALRGARLANHRSPLS